MKVIERQFGKQAIRVIDTKPDGNCLLRSLAHGLHQLKKSKENGEDLQQSLRYKCFAHINEYQTEFREQLLYNVEEKHEDSGDSYKLTDEEKISEALNDLATLGTFCGTEVIQAFCNTKQMKVKLLTVAGYEIEFLPKQKLTSEPMEEIEVYFSNRHYETVATACQIKAAKQKTKI